ncbi:MAG TPA: signal peptide peptidase SppA [Kofleriaceae bacterium]|nr:signal peptide peptidase SppA [Kofleriaceae bacterium]
MVLRRLPALSLIGLVACASPAPQGKPAGDDPWSKPARADDKPDDDEHYDLKSVLAKIADNLGKPGPYDPLDASPGYDETKPHWGVLAVRGPIVEREAFAWSGERGLELRALTDRLHALAGDGKLTGVVLRFDGLEVSQPDAIELRAALHDLRKAGKRLACHAENASNVAYLVLAACDHIGLAPLGDVVISGPAAMPVHVKPLLDKLGVQADFLHIGAYKGAAEPLTLDAPSKESGETLAAILDRRYQTMVDVIAADRKLAPAQVAPLIDTALFPAEAARAANLVDDVATFEVFRDAARGKEAWTKLALDPDQHDRLTTMLKLSRFFGVVPPDRPAGPHVAVVYALGNIVDGRGDGVLGARAQIAARTLVPALRAIAREPTIKAVVLRIDSGGGSAQASELIWRAVDELNQAKPVIVSMSDVAASGGYYIASGASKIFALDDTLTGSIGVVGGKLALAGALDKLGVHTFPIGRGKRATMNLGLGPWTDDERGAIRASMEGVYKVFVGRVAAGRHQPAEAIAKIAEGRVWTGARAKELGLVDAIGGLDAALAEARTRGKVDPATPLEIYPPAVNLRDVVASYGEVQAPLVGLGLDAAPALLAAVRAIDPRLAAASEHLIQRVLSFRSSAIQTLAILPELP